MCYKEKAVPVISLLTLYYNMVSLGDWNAFKTFKITWRVTLNTGVKMF